MDDTEQPLILHWEHGYRTHGLWTDSNERVGAVALGPRNLWNGIYRWWIDNGPDLVFEARTLKSAKGAVEQAVRKNTKRPVTVRKT